MDASAAITVCALTSRSSRSVLALAAALRERGDDLRFPCRQAPRLPRCQRSQLYGTELRPHQALDLQPQRFTQSSYLSRPALGNRDLDLPRSPADSARLKLPRDDPSILKLYPLHSCSCRGGTVTAHGSQVSPLYLGARMCQFVRRFTVCSQEKHTFGHVIEPADVCHAGSIVDDVEHGTASGGIRPGGEDSGRLVEDDPSGFRWPCDWFAVHEDLVAFGIHGLADHRDLTVDAYPPRGDEVVSGSSRGDSGARYDALNPHGFGHQSARGAASPLSLVGAPTATGGVVAVGPACRGARKAIASSSARGSSSRCLSANCSRNDDVVPYRSGRPSPSPRPTTSINPRSWSDLRIAPAPTPRISSISARPIG